MRRDSVVVSLAPSASPVALMRIDVCFLVSTVDLWVADLILSLENNDERYHRKRVFENLIVR